MTLLIMAQATVESLPGLALDSCPSGALPQGRESARCLGAVRRKVLRQEADWNSLRGGMCQESFVGPIDYLVAGTGELVTPEQVFPRLRWGGQFIFVSRDAWTVNQMVQHYRGQGGFQVEHGPAQMRVGCWGLPVPLLGRRLHYFVARKVALIPPGATTDRFTFDVQLIRPKPPEHEFIVQKQVPSYSSVLQRLQQRFPETELEVLANRARKLVDKVFPIFLTREAGFLTRLQQDLPPAYRDRVPKVLHARHDAMGMVRCLTMNWLRVGGRKLSHLEFARQSAELLSILHEQAGILHMDLRLDNFVITPRGVGFVDFGSAVRIGEDLSQSPMLGNLFDEMMSTSQIQRLLGKMKSTGKVTSRVLLDGHQKLDKAADLFYLAMQINQPHSHPELCHLIEYDPDSDIARRIGLLTSAILRPSDPERPRFITARDVLAGLRRIEEKTKSPPMAGSSQSADGATAMDF